MKWNIMLFVIGLILFGVGCGYAVLEIADYDRVSLHGENFYKYKERFNLKEIEHTYNIDDINVIRHYKGRINYIVEESFVDTFHVSIRYSADYLRLETYEQNNALVIDSVFQRRDRNLRHFINNTKEMVRDKVMHDSFIYADILITITTSRENIDRLGVNRKHYYQGFPF